MESVGFSDASLDILWNASPVAEPSRWGVSVPGGFSSMTVREHRVRDHFAARYVRAKTEARMDFGRVDVMTEEFAVEVEPFATWKHGVRQALAYAQESGKRPAVAIYGDITGNEATRVWNQCAGLVTVFLLDGDRWYRIRSAEQAYRQWAAPPDDLAAKPRPPRRRLRDWNDKRTIDECLRDAAAAMDRAMGSAA
jgi:hypothetical protein